MTIGKPTKGRKGKYETNHGDVFDDLPIGAIIARIRCRYSSVYCKKGRIV